MLILSDFKLVKVKNKDGVRLNKLYHCFCDQCHKDKGYQAKSYKCLLCNNCAQKGILRYVGDKIQCPTVDFNDFMINKHDHIRTFRCKCIRCGKDRGYQRPNRFNRLCKSCSTHDSKTGKTSPKKGIKTNLPAWNRGIYFGDTIKQQLRNRMSSRLRHALHGRHLSKKWLHIFNILGYSVKDLQASIESKFLPSMTWENMGKWHIDHITPESWFHYSSIHDENFKKCWSLDNLQPLWAYNNRSKGNRYRG
jgi:hypothetical protein